MASPFQFAGTESVKLIDDKKLCSSSTGDFVKANILSPDGTSTLMSSESNYLTCWSVGDITSAYMYYESTTGNDPPSNSTMTLTGAYQVGEAIYSYAWYPHMNSQYSPSCCFISTSRDHPIQLWDVASGEIRCSYLGHNHLDELDSALSVTFNLDGNKIYAGSNRMIRCFDVEHPGKQCTDIPTSKTRRAKQGQKGLISDLSFNPDRSGCFAAGSYDMSVGIYVENERACAMELRGLDFGVTCTRWSPCGTMLWVGGRKHSDLVCYDIRNTGQELGRVHRDLTTNQRMTFALDPWGAYLATGTESGRLIVYDVKTFAAVHSSQISMSCVNSVEYHPYSAVIVGSAGQRSFVVDSDEPVGFEDEKWSELFLLGVDHKKLSIPADSVEKCP